MLTNIYIKNFTIIDELDLPCYLGMTVLTGETGAGKSIIIDAIELVLGKRVNSNIVRPGAMQADIILNFDVNDLPAAKTYLKDHEFYVEDSCILRRTISADGRTKSFINNIPTTLKSLGELADLLINIHGQHEFQNLLKSSRQLELLDRFAKHQKLLLKATQAYNILQDCYLQLQHAKEKMVNPEQQIGFLQYQLNELNELNFCENELQKLQEEHQQLANADKILANGKLVLQILLDNENGAVLQQLYQAINIINDIQSLVPQLQNSINLIKESILPLEEASHELQRFFSQLQADPSRLQYLEQRLALIHDIAKKHHVPPESLPKIQQAIEEKLDCLHNHDKHIEKLKQKLNIAEQDYYKIAQELTASRKKEAKNLSQLITKNIHKLAMPNGEFEIKLLTRGKPHPTGMEKIDFLISTNLGHPKQNLNQIVSGGELSRVNLAIEVITAKSKITPCLIFDEIDVGIGGATADIVGKLLKKLSCSTQAFCITHLPQIAAKAEQHLKITKVNVGNTTVAKTSYLENESRIMELARMLGGSKITEQTVAHAKEMLLELNVQNST